MISSLLTAIRKSLRLLAEFLAVLVLGLTASIIILLPWLLRALALMGWLAVWAFGQWQQDRLVQLFEQLPARLSQVLHSLLV